MNLMTRDMIGNFEIDEILSVLNGHLNYLGIRDFSLSQYVGQGQAEILFDQTGHRGEKFPEKQLISGGLARLPRPYYRHVLPLFYRKVTINRNLFILFIILFTIQFYISSITYISLY